MDKSASIYVAGGNNMIRDRFLALLRGKGYSNLANDRAGEPDVQNIARLTEYFDITSPEYVFVTGGKVGGIQANQQFPAELMLDNLQVVCNLIQVSHIHNVKKLLYIASSCSYPKHAEQPMQPEMLMTGSLETTNAAYATANLAGIELVSAYRKQYNVNYVSVIPANVFGPGDKFDQDASHVIGALLAKFYQAQKSDIQSVEIWGSGTPRREFIYLDDLVDACIFVINEYDGLPPLNIGTGQVMSIAEVASKLKKITAYKGDLVYNTNKPDGMPEKVLDSSKLFAMGWTPKYRFDESVNITYQWYMETLLN